MKDQPIEITDTMALAFHRALTDGSIGQAEVDEIKVGLRAAFAHIEAGHQHRGEPDACGFVPVQNSAVDWLKKHYPALCVKSGLCEKIAGRLYTITRLSFSAPQPAEPTRLGYTLSDVHEAYSRGKAEALKAQPLIDMLETLCTGLEWNIENHPEAMNEADVEALANARALLARYSQPAQPAASAEPLVRYCPGCGSIGPVEDKYRDCCPDGNQARMIPQTLAEKCRDTFKVAIRTMLSEQACNDAASVAAHPCVPPEWVSEQVGGEFDDMTAGQGYRRGWNECRAAMLSAAPTPPAGGQGS
ncbi:MAG: hypothetical protein WBA83_17080 [Burkholderiaceae bacterium]